MQGSDRMIRVDMLACACVCVCLQGSDGILKVDMVEPRLAQKYTVCQCVSVAILAQVFKYMAKS